MSNMQLSKINRRFQIFRLKDKTKLSAQAKMYNK